jgi:hypothetical protein
MKEMELTRIRMRLREVGKQIASLDREYQSTIDHLRCNVLQNVLRDLKAERSKLQERDLRITSGLLDVEAEAEAQDALARKAKAASTEEPPAEGWENIIKGLEPPDVPEGVSRLADEQRHSLLNAWEEYSHDTLCKILRDAGVGPERLLEAEVLATIFAIVDGSALHTASVVKDLRRRLDEVEEGGIRYQGTWQRAAEYRRGHAVTDNGSLWIAIRNVDGERPGTGDAWQLAAKAGKDAR